MGCGNEIIQWIMLACFAVVALNQVAANRMMLEGYKELCDYVYTGREPKDGFPLDELQ